MIGGGRRSATAARLKIGGCRRSVTPEHTDQRKPPIMGADTADAAGGRTVARYRAIAADLAAKIRDGHYVPGEALPAQRELSTAYGVTLMTLRQALRELSAEGLIVQQPGKGTFVAPPHAAYQLGSLRSFGDDLREQGHEVRTTVISRAQRRVPSRVAARLRVREAETGLRLERVRAFAGRRAIHQISWVREPHADRLRDVDFTGTSLYAALADLGVVVARAAETIRPEVLNAERGPVSGRGRGSAGASQRPDHVRARRDGPGGGPGDDAGKHDADHRRAGRHGAVPPLGSGLARPRRSGSRTRGHRGVTAQGYDREQTASPTRLRHPYRAAAQPLGR